MSIFLVAICIVVFMVGMFDFLYYLPNFKALEEAESKCNIDVINKK